MGVVEKGLREGYGDALVTKECIGQGWTKISTLTEKEVIL